MAVEMEKRDRMVTFCLVTLMALIFLSMFGFVGCALTEMIRQGKEADDPIPIWVVLLSIALLLIPFGLLGLLALYASTLNFMSLFCPQLKVKCSRTRVRAGDEFEVEWEFIGKADSIQKVELSLVGFDKTERSLVAVIRGFIRRGNLLETIALYSTTDPAEIVQGRAVCQVPDHAAPTKISGMRNKQWGIVVRGRIRGWLDVCASDSFVVVEA